MTRYVIDTDVALRLTADAVAVGGEHRLVAPALLKSQVLSALYQAVRTGEVTKQEADARLNRLRELKIRYLSDRVSQATAWRLAERLGWGDTLRAEYVAVAVLQADALVTLDPAFAEQLGGIVPVASLQDLIG